jgi:hypothetical protein
MRLYFLENALSDLRWYHWLGLLTGLFAAAALAGSLGWLPDPPPPGGYQPPR